MQLSFLLLIWESKLIQTFHGEIQNHMKKQAVLDTRSAGACLIIHLSADLTVKFNFNCPKRNFTNWQTQLEKLTPGQHCWSQGQGSHGDRLQSAAQPCSQGRSRKEPTCHWRCPQLLSNSASGALAVVAHRGEAPPSPQQHKAFWFWFFTEERMVRGESLWHTAGHPWIQQAPKYVCQFGRTPLYITGSSAMIRWKNTGLWPKQRSGRNKQASKHLQPSPESKGLD